MRERIGATLPRQALLALPMKRGDLLRLLYTWILSEMALEVAKGYEFSCRETEDGVYLEARRLDV